MAQVFLPVYRNRKMKEIAGLLTKYLSNTVEVAAAFIIGPALLQVLYRYAYLLVIKSDRTTNEQIRIQFGSSVAVALELLAGAEGLAMAAIAIWRTALNYFLEKELESVEKKNPIQGPVFTASDWPHFKA